MVVDAVLGFVESILRTVIGWMPALCLKGVICVEGHDHTRGWLGMGNLAPGLWETVQPFLSFANAFLPLDILLVMIGTWFGVTAIIAGMRLVWRLLPGFG